jgi:hypothetical protein
MITGTDPIITPNLCQNTKNKKVRGPGIEPGSTAWKATMLTITPAAHCCEKYSHWAKMEEQGIDPCASWMQTKRSTI